MKTDPCLEEIYRTRDRIAAKCDHDPVKLIAYYREIQRCLVQDKTTDSARRSKKKLAAATR